MIINTKAFIVSAMAVISAINLSGETYTYYSSNWNEISDTFDINGPVLSLICLDLGKTTVINDCNIESNIIRHNQYKSTGAYTMDIELLSKQDIPSEISIKSNTVESNDSVYNYGYSTHRFVTLSGSRATVENNTLNSKYGIIPFRFSDGNSYLYFSKNKCEGLTVLGFLLR